jgi:hypothetical protein
MSPIVGIFFTLALLFLAIRGFRNALLAHRRVKAALLLTVVILLAAIVVTGGYVGFGAGFGVSTQQGGG